MADTMLYIRVSGKTISDIAKVAGAGSITVRDKSALAICCEKLLEWAAASAAHGKEAELELEKRRLREEMKAGKIKAAELVKRTIERKETENGQ